MPAGSAGREQHERRAARLDHAGAPGGERRVPALASSSRARTLARQSEQHAHAVGERDHRGAAIGDERQRHALGGHQMQVDRHVDGRLQAEQNRQARRRRSARTGPRCACAWRSARSTIKANKATSSRQSTMPNSSAATANTKSVWLSGRMRLTVPSPGPRPNQPPRWNDLERLIDVEGVARGGIEEALDAPRDVRHREIGGRQPDRRGAGEPDHPDDPHAGQEEQRAPHAARSAWSGRNRAAARAGHRQQQQRERHGVGRHFRPPGGFRRTARRPGSRRPA